MIIKLNFILNYKNAYTFYFKNNYKKYLYIIQFRAYDLNIL